MVRKHDPTMDNISKEIDQLTGTLLKQKFYEYATEEINKHESRPYCLVLLDIEALKLINERYGESTGNHVLWEISKFLRSSLPANTLIGRYSGSKIAFLCRHSGRPIETFITYLHRAMIKQLQLPEIAIKFGGYEDIDHSLSMSAICDRALMALTTIQHRYGKIYARFDNEFLEHSVKVQRIELSMEEAIKTNQFKVYYQPKHDATTGKLVGAEALIRWTHPEYGFMSPGDFLPLFEKNGFITKTDYFVWSRTCENLRRWINKGIPVVPISVNASRLDFKQNNFLDIMNAPVDKYRIDKQYLHIEVTETLFIDSMDEIVKILNEARKEGYQVELDDFGSGYSSLNTLGTLPLDVLKLDMSFMRNLHDERRARILYACINMGKSLKLKTIAEGVENNEQLSILRNMGVDSIQGYFYSRPLPEDEFEEYMQNQFRIDSNSEPVVNNSEIPPNSVFIPDSLEAAKAREAHEKEIRLQYMDLIQALSDDYTNVFTINLKNGEHSIFRFAGQAYGVAQNRENNKSYDYTLDQYIDNDVVPEDREMCHRLFKMENILKILEKKQSVSYVYRILRKGEMHYIRVKYMKMGEGNYADSIAFAYMDVDKEMAEKKKAFAAKEEFIKHYYSKLKTPLQSIIGYADVARNFTDNQEMIDDYLNRIRVSANYVLGQLKE